jgi:hypothetical protein
LLSIRITSSVKLEFGGVPPRAMRARCIAFRYCPDPLGILTAEELDKLELDYSFKHYEYRSFIALLLV